MKYCEDCRYFDDGVKENPRCSHPESVVDLSQSPVTRQVDSMAPSCWRARLLGEKCGEDGDLFEPREDQSTGEKQPPHVGSAPRSWIRRLCKFSRPWTT